MKRNPKPGTGLKVVLTLLILLNSAGIVKVLSAKQLFINIYTFLNDDTVLWITALPAGSIIAMIAMWTGKRWGLNMAFVIYLIVLILDLAFQVWSHALLASCGMALLIYFARLSGFWGNNAPSADQQESASHHVGG